MAIAISNLEYSLDLQVIVTCDSSLVTGYFVNYDKNNETEEISNPATSKYKCGDRVRIQQNKFGSITLIQDAGTSSLSYELKKYEGFVATPAAIAGIVGGVIGALVLIGFGIYCYRRH